MAHRLVGRSGNPGREEGAGVHEGGESSLLKERRRKLEKLRKSGWSYPNDFFPSASSAELHARYGQEEPEAFKERRERTAVAGRIAFKRVMGKAAFLVVNDGSGSIQLYVRADAESGAAFELCKTFDLGDIVGSEGHLFFTKTGELTVNCDRLCLLAKSLRPMPEKYHGLTDQETKYRRRYLSLMADPGEREVFRKRSLLIGAIRKFLADLGFLEVETPMMQPIPGGAAAKPFITHHNELHRDLYLRIAPELYLKRLLVGGFERVFEINRSFRNEGISPQHNPEFTMLEYYMAYGNRQIAQEQITALLKTCAQEVLGEDSFMYRGTRIDFSGEFRELTPAQVLTTCCGISEAEATDRGCLLAKLGELEGEKVCKVIEQDDTNVLQYRLFEKIGEPKLLQPTYVVNLPAAVSPLSRRQDGDPGIADRFELFVGGMEVVNGFSELNDPDVQSEVFRQQAEQLAQGKEDAMWYDDDYVYALEHGMPPALGIGLGIDRLTMLLTDSPSIRDVILFPMLRERRTE